MTDEERKRSEEIRKLSHDDCDCQFLLSLLDRADPPLPDGVASVKRPSNEEWLRDRLVKITERMDKAEAEAQDWRDSADSAAGEMCGDEKHCTCVPLLRKCLKDAEAERKELSDRNYVLEHANDFLGVNQNALLARQDETITRLTKERDKLRGERDEVIGLIRWAQKADGDSNWTDWNEKARAILAKLEAK